LEDSAEADEVDEEIPEHLHQVFVTKNYVLCAQMKNGSTTWQPLMTSLGLTWNMN